MADETHSSAAPPTTNEEDSHTSYPSPISTAGSSHTRPTSRQSTEELIRQEREDSQNSLRAASAVLQAAYRRIRQVRRSLVEFTDPAESPNEGIGPGHSALVLTTSPIDDGSEDDALDFETMRANLAEMNRQTQEYLDRFQASTTTPEHPPVLSGLRNVQLPTPAASIDDGAPHPGRRRSFLETQIARRRQLHHSDDPNTILGRRVAAREAAGTSSSSSSSSSVRAAVEGSPHAEQVLRAVEMERELLHLRSNGAHLQRRTDPGQRTLGRLETFATARADAIRVARSSLDMEMARLRQHQHQQQQQLSAAPLSPRSTNMTRRWRASRSSDSRQSSTNSSQSLASLPHRERLSLLSNFSSIQNLQTPTSAHAPGPLLFEEPESYSRRLSRDFLESPVGTDRRFSVLGTSQLNEEESIRDSLWEELDEVNASWESTIWDTLPRDGGTRPRPAPNPSPVPGRHRGWARLDANGDLIPSDEEEEYERIRLEARMESLRQARASTATAVMAEAGRQAQSALLLPPRVIRTSISPVDQPERDHPRVHLNSREQRPDWSEVEGQYGSAVPYRVNPLPAPLEDMVTLKSKSTSRPMRFSREAMLACH